MAKKSTKVKKAGKYSRSKVVRVHKDSVIEIMEKLLSYFAGKGNTKEIKVEGLSSNMMIWNIGCHSRFLKWLNKNGVVEDAGLVMDACFIGRTRLKKIKKKPLKKLKEMIENGGEEYIVIYPL